MEVTASVWISLPPGEVAGFALEPGNEPRWIGGIVESRPLTGTPITQGAQVQRIAKFMGKRIEYVLEVTEMEQPGKVVMKSIKGPFPMVVTYEFRQEGEGTRASIRLQGDAGGYYRVGKWLLEPMSRRSIARDLRTLKKIIESRAASAARNGGA